MNDGPDRMFGSLKVMFTLFSAAVLAGGGWTDREQNSDEPVEMLLPGWNTNTAKRTVELDELQSGGPGKDGTPAIDKPKFVGPDKTEQWLKAREPVISLVIDGEAKAYPLQVLIWHEIVNDRI
ncbi:MAG: DUF3179 domain-containing (seleno)protein, partial [Planctomycetota bacterium]